MKRSVLNLAWLLLGILAISAALIALGRRDAVSDPRADSFHPSGLSAFAGLLRANGYEVASTTSPLPKLSKGDVVVACLDPERSEEIDSDGSGAAKRIAEFVEGGGRAILLPFDSDFGRGSRAVADSPITMESTVRPGKQFQVKVSPGAVELELYRFLPQDLTSPAIWEGKADHQGYAALTKDGKGVLLTVSDGIIASNRYIDQAQNAGLLVSLVSTVAPKGSRLLFTEATYTNTQPGMIELLGPAVVGLWYQGIFLFVVIVFTLGKRFGLPEEVRVVQTGQRELVNAVADAYRRARSTRVACRAAYDRADFEVRRAVKLAGDAPASERDLRIPPELGAEFRRTFEGTIDTLTPQEAFARCQSLRRHVRSFLSKG